MKTYKDLCIPECRFDTIDTLQAEMCEESGDCLHIECRVCLFDRTNIKTFKRWFLEKIQSEESPEC